MLISRCAGGCAGQAAACPQDPTKKQAPSASFYQYFAQAGQAAQAACLQPDACMATSACWAGLLGAQLTGFATETEAVDHALACAPALGGIEA